MGLPSENGHVFRLVWKASPCMEVLLDRGSSRSDPKRGQREAAGDFSEPHSEGTVFGSTGCRGSSADRARRNQGGLLALPFLLRYFRSSPCKPISAQRPNGASAS